MVVEVVPEPTGQVANVRHENDHAPTRTDHPVAFVQGVEQHVLVGYVLEEVRREHDIDFAVQQDAQIGREELQHLDVAIGEAGGRRIRVDRYAPLGRARC